MVSQDQRAALAELQRAISEAQAAANERIRIYRNTLIIAIIVLVIACIALPIVVGVLPTDLLVMRPVAEGQAPDLTKPVALDVITIQVWGVVGGLVGLVTSLRRLNTSKNPAQLQIYQLLLKLPAGAITAVFGLVFLQSGIIPGIKIASVAQLAAYAVLFGFAQEAATALVDRQASRLLDDAKSVDEKSSDSGN